MNPDIAYNTLMNMWHAQQVMGLAQPVAPHIPDKAGNHTARLTYVIYRCSFVQVEGGHKRARLLRRPTREDAGRVARVVARLGNRKK